MIKVENTDVWGFEHAISNIHAKGYRKTENNKFMAFTSDNNKKLNLGTYNTEEEAKKAIYNYRIKRFFRECEKINLNPYDGREYEKNYIAFPSGDVLNLHGKKMIGAINKNGYINITINGKNIDIHRIIGKLFVDNPNNFPVINHINGIKTDNRMSNLEWCTYSYNTIHSYNIGLQQKQFGENTSNHKLTNDNVKYIKNVYQKDHPEYGIIALSKKFNVNRTTISRIIRGETWRDVE